MLSSVTSDSFDAILPVIEEAILKPESGQRKRKTEKN
jgi:hypothetical protein